MNGFSLHAAVRRGADERQVREQLCRYIARPALIAHDDEREFADQAAGGTSIGLIRGSNPSGGTELQLTSFLHHFLGRDRDIGTGNISHRNRGMMGYR